MISTCTSLSISRLVNKELLYNNIGKLRILGDVSQVLLVMYFENILSKNLKNSFIVFILIKIAPIQNQRLIKKGKPINPIQ